jgi:hypothetical protein
MGRIWLPVVLVCYLYDTFHLFSCFGDPRGTRRHCAEHGFRNHAAPGRRRTGEQAGFSACQGNSACTPAKKQPVIALSNQPTGHKRTWERITSNPVTQISSNKKIVRPASASEYSVEQLHGLYRDNIESFKQLSFFGLSNETLSIIAPVCF